MKYVGWIIIWVVLGALGYFLYPHLAPAMLGGAAASSSQQKGPQHVFEVIINSPEGQMVSKVDALTVATEELPSRGILNADADVTDGQNQVTLKKNNKIVPIRLEGTDLYFSAASNEKLEGKINIGFTNVLGLIAEKRLGLGEKEVSSPPKAAPVSVPEPVAVAPVTPALQPVKADPVIVDQDNPFQEEVGPTSAPEEQQPVEPQVQNEPEPVESGPEINNEALQGGGLAEVIKKSLKSGQIKEFTGDQVSALKAGKEEMIDGETYQVGLVNYQAETIFGTQDIEAKALIQGGKVIKWLWVSSGMEIK